MGSPDAATTDTDCSVHFFDDVKAILFVVNLAGYNMVLFEDDQQNRMMEVGDSTLSRRDRGC